ncbi:hypothetical protein IAT38_006958 [Cryptococcus sp. DSM 104549]
MSPLGTVSTSSLIGVGIACGGNVLISLALTVQKLAHRRNEEQVALSHSTSHSSLSPSSSTPSSPGPSRAPAPYTPVRSAPPSRPLSPSPSPIPEEDEPPSPAVAGGAGDEVATVPAVPVVLVPAPAKNGEPSGLEVQTLGFGESRSRSRSRSRGRKGDTSESRSRNTSQGGANSRATSPAPAPILPGKYTSLRVKLADSPRGHKHQHGDGHGAHVSNGHVDLSDDAHDNGVGEEGGGEVEEGMYLRSKLWWLGMALIAVGEGGNFLSYGFAPASVVAPLGTVALIANCVFAPLILREKFYKKELVGMALAIVGAVTVVWSSSNTNPRLSPSELLSALSQPSFLVYTLLNILLLLPLLLLSRSFYGARYIAIDIGICALFGGYTVLATKALSSLLSENFFGAWREGVTWGCVAVVGGTSLGQIRWLNRALMRFQSKEVIPTQFVFFTLAAIIGSAVLYQEFRDIPFSRFINFAFGIATTFLGVHLLTTTSSSTPDSDSTLDASTPTQPLLPPRASSSTSLNLLLPTTTGERAPLLPASPPPVSAMSSPRAPEIARGYSELSVGSRRGASTAPISFPGSGSLGASTSTGGARVRIALGKRGSTGEFAHPKLGLGSQAGLLLLATTPPGPGPGVGMGRGRSWSRGSDVWDEERGEAGQGRTRRASGGYTGTQR